MSNQNRFLLPHSTSAKTGPAAANANANLSPSSLESTNSEQENKQLSVDTDFDSYWEEEARNPHRNRIRIGRQYQATVPPLLRVGEKDKRSLEELETLSFCPKKSARVTDAELDHYFTVAKSLNLFASLVETRSLLGRDVTIADLNHIRNKEGLSLASVIQPVRQPASHSNSNTSPLSSQQSTINTASQQTQNKSPQSSCDKTSPLTVFSPKDQTTAENSTHNQPLMKALSHFISLHHPCRHDRECKKLLKDVPLEDPPTVAVSITAGNLRQGSSSSSSKESKPSRSRSSLKQALQASSQALKEEPERDHQSEQSHAFSDNLKSPSYDDWSKEEVELFSKAIEVCGKNFGSIKKEFLPSRSVKSIVEYYYIGSRDVSETKKKSNQSAEMGDSCSSPEKSTAYNNNQGGGDGPSMSGKSGSNSSAAGTSNSTLTSSSRTTASNHNPSNSSKTLSDTNGESKQALSNSDVSKTVSSSKRLKSDIQDSSCVKSKPKNIDARLSVYNFDEELREESPTRFECPRPGAEVKPLKAKPIIPESSLNSDATNSNVGSLKFFMDGQLVLKLNACQEQQEGVEKFHWVQSGDKIVNASRLKRYPKRADKNQESNQNGSQSNSVVSSYQDDDSKTDDLTGDEDSKESMNSCTNLPKQKSHQQGSPNQKRPKTKAEPTLQQGQQVQSPLDYNRIALNNRIKERNDQINPSPVISQAMPWLQANSFAMAAALLGGCFPPATSSIVEGPTQGSTNTVNMSSKPMDLSLEHGVPKSIQKSTSRSRSKSKNA